VTVVAAFDFLAPGLRLRRFLRDGGGCRGPVGQLAEPFFGQVDHPLLVQVGRDRQNGVRRVVVGTVEGFDIGKRRFGYVVGREADGGPAVGVHLVGQGPQQQRLVAVGLVQIALPVFFDDHLFLGLQLLGRDVQPSHAVAFEPQGRFDVGRRQGDVEVGVVVVGEGVVVARSHLHRQVEIGHGFRAAEHEVLEQMGESRACGIFVARPHLVEHVHGGQFRRAVAVCYDRQAVGEYLFAVGNHGGQR